MNWFETAQAQLQMETGQGCEAGHTRHNRKIVPVHAPGFLGPMTIFNAAKYRDTYGFCPGDDDVSRTLAMYGIWEPIETGVVVEALNRSEGIVIDFGSQIGWYSMLATHSDHDVLAIEGVAEHEELTRINCEGRLGDLWQAQHWLNEHTLKLSVEGCPPVALVKIDVEGAEEHALRCIRNLLDADLVQNILMEVSPVFNDSYEELVAELLSRGFSATALNPVQPLTAENYLTLLAEIPQFDVMFSK